MSVGGEGGRINCRITIHFMRGSQTFTAHILLCGIKKKTKNHHKFRSGNTSQVCIKTGSYKVSQGFRNIPEVLIIL